MVIRFNIYKLIVFNDRVNWLIKPTIACRNKREDGSGADADGGAGSDHLCLHDLLCAVGQLG